MKQERPFNWQGKPSTFSTDKDRAHFIGSNHGRSVNVSALEKRSPISLPGGSKELPPHFMRKPQ